MSTQAWQHPALFTLGHYSTIKIMHFTTTMAAAAAKSLQSCPTLCDPIDSSPPGYPVPGILQARTLEWVAISFSNAWKWKVKVKLLSRVWLLATPWTAAYQTPLSMGFSRQEYWSGVLLPSPTGEWQGKPNQGNMYPSHTHPTLPTPPPLSSSQGIEWNWPHLATKALLVRITNQIWKLF